MRIQKKVKVEKNNVADVKKALKYALSEDYETYTKTGSDTIFHTYARIKSRERVYIGSIFLGCEFRDTFDGNNIDFYVEVDKKPSNKKRDYIFNKKIYEIIDNVIEKMAIEAYHSYLYKKQKKGYMSDPERAVSHSQVPISNSNIVFWQTTEIFIKRSFNNTPKREKALARKSDRWHDIEERKNMLPNLIDFLNCFLEGDEITEKYVVDKATEKFKEKIKEEKEK